jgi:hypothetical protein
MRSSTSNVLRASVDGSMRNSSPSAGFPVIFTDWPLISIAWPDT